jgi:hypothetical protein
MPFKWKDAFTQVPEYIWRDAHSLTHPTSISTLENLKRFLEFVNIKFCLLRPFFEQENYPLVTPQELLPSFESNLYEYANLPGYSLVALDRPLDYFNEIFQFDILHCLYDAVDSSLGPASPLESVVVQHNHHTFQSRLPKVLQERFRKRLDKMPLTDLTNYPKVLPYLLQMDRGHLMAKNSYGDYYLSGVYASFPSDLDSELKRFGLRIGKFKPGDNNLYELNRNFVYQFLMELYGYPIASERRTSAALFARRLFKMGEDFLVQALAQSDRAITTMYSTPEIKSYPQVEKIALVSMARTQKDQLERLRRGGFVIGRDRPAVILRVIYRQHKYDPDNVRKDRALSVARQEVIHPLTGELCTTANIIKDTALMTLILNDIVKGEYKGRVKYKRNEIVEDTETHENRLKFLYAWLRKHQRRILSYSDEFYANVTRVLENYLLNPNHADIFNELHGLYQDVWEQYSFIQQARKIKQLEDLKFNRHKGRRISYLEMLQHATAILQELKFEIVKYFDSLVNNAIRISEQILNDSYLLKKYIHKPQHELTPYGQKIRSYYGQLVKLVDDLLAIRKSRRDQRSTSPRKERTV